MKAVLSLEVLDLTVPLQLVKGVIRQISILAIFHADKLVADWTASVLAPNVDEEDRGHQDQVICSKAAFSQLVQRVDKDFPHLK